MKATSPQFYDLTESNGLTVAPTSILLADRHPTTRMGVRRRFEREPGFVVVAEATNGHEALELIDGHRPDVAIVDLRMSELDGVAVAESVALTEIPTRVLLLTDITEPQLVQHALDAGVRGFVGKDSPLDVIVAAVEAVMRGSRYIDPSLVAGLLDPQDEHMSDREREVLQHAANGMQNKQIAARMGLSEETIKSQVRNIIRKLHAHSRTEAVASALRRALIV